MNAVASALEMSVDNLLESRIQRQQGLRVLGCLEVLAHGLEVPQSGVQTVVFRLPACVGKIVGQHSRVDVAGKSEKNFSGNFGTAGGQREARQGNHGVTAPIAKPVIAGDDGSSVRLLRQTSRHNELIGGKDELADPGRRGRGGSSITF